MKKYFNVCFVLNKTLSANRIFKVGFFSYTNNNVRQIRVEFQTWSKISCLLLTKRFSHKKGLRQLRQQYQLNQSLQKRPIQIYGRKNRSKMVNAYYTVMIIFGNILYFRRLDSTFSWRSYWHRRTERSGHMEIRMAKMDLDISPVCRRYRHI